MEKMRVDETTTPSKQKVVSDGPVVNTPADHNPTTDNPPDILAEALKLAAAGAVVFPLHAPNADGTCDCGNPDCKDIGKHPRTNSGFNDATADPKRIRKWWTKWPQANIGMATSRTMPALDIDPRNGGDETLAELIAKHGPLPRTVKSLTGGDGEHYIFQVDRAYKLKSPGPGIDVKGKGYIVAAPSLHKSGKRYRWEVAPWDTDPAEAPHWLIDAAKPPTTTPQGKKGGRPKTKVGSSSRDEVMDRLPKDLQDQMKSEVDDRSKLVTDVVQQMMKLCLSDDEIILVSATASFFAKFAERGEEGVREEIDRQRAFWISEGSKVSDGARPVVVVRAGRLSAMVDEAEAHLIAAGAQVYQVHSVLRRPVVVEATASRGRKTKTAALAPLNEAYLNDLLSKHVRWRKYVMREGKWIDADVPERVPSVLLNRFGDWNFAHLRGVISTPTLRPDGTILNTAGYDPATELFLADAVELPPMPETPTRDDALRALELLEGLLVEFPFIDEAARAVALSGFLTVVARAALAYAPMHVVSATDAGTGKSYYVDLVGAVSFGMPTPVLAASKSHEETDKTIRAAMMLGAPVISLDNLENDLQSGVLSQALSQDKVEVRRFGVLETVQIPNRAVFFATGNNLALIGDLARRSIVTSMDAGVARPELRQFKDKPFERIIANRGQYIAACLTICRAYILAGRPGLLPRLANFNDWSDTVRSALVWLGKADPASTIELIRGEDPSRQRLEAFLEAVDAEINANARVPVEFTAGEIIAKARLMTEPENKNEPPRYVHPMLHSAVQEITPQYSSNSFGIWLRANKGKVMQMLVLRRREPRSGYHVAVVTPKETKP